MGTSCKGHTLPLALAGILVAVAMLRSFHDRATSLVQSWRHARAGAALENDVLASAADAAPSPGRCTPLAVQALHGYAERVVCHEPLPVLSSFPNVALPTLRLDFDSIFSRAAPCAGEPHDVTPGDNDAVPTSSTFSAGDDFAWSPDSKEIAFTAPPAVLREQVGEVVACERVAGAAAQRTAIAGLGLGAASETLLAAAGRGRRDGRNQGGPSRVPGTATREGY